MSARSWLARSRTVGALLSDVHLTLRLLREPAVPAYLKVVPFAALAYVLSPLDLLPDFIPIIGQLDDLGVDVLPAGVRMVPGCHGWVFLWERMPFRLKVGRSRGFEPPTPRITILCSNQLSYDRRRRGEIRECFPPCQTLLPADGERNQPVPRIILLFSRML